MMTAWVVLFIAQVRLISARAVRLHQRCGYAGTGLGATIIATGLPTANRAAKYRSASTPPGIPPLGFMIVPLFDLLIGAGPDPGRGSAGIRTAGSTESSPLVLLRWWCHTP